MIHEWLWRSSMIIRRHDLPYIGKRNMSLTCLVLQPTIKFFSHSKCPFKSVKSHSWFHGEKNLGHKKEAKQQFSFLKLFLCHPKPQNPSYPPANAAKPTSSFQLFSSQLRFPNKTQHSSYYLILCTSKVHSSAAKTPMFQLRPLSCSKIWTMDWSMNRWMQLVAIGYTWWDTDHLVGGWTEPKNMIIKFFHHFLHFNSWKLPSGKNACCSRVQKLPNASIFKVKLGWAG